MNDKEVATHEICCLQNGFEYDSACFLYKVGISSGAEWNRVNLVYTNYSLLAN